MKVAIEVSSLPISLRFEKPLSDDQLLRVCANNELLRIERERCDDESLRHGQECDQLGTKLRVEDLVASHRWRNRLRVECRF